MTTQTAGGEPATPVSNVTNPTQIKGDVARRVIPVTDGRAVKGEAAEQVYYVQTGDLVEHGGRFKVSGEKAIPIVNVTGRAVRGGPAMPVYDVTGLAEPLNIVGAGGGGDPIGDALRADAIGYWKMDEVVSPWVDSTAGNHNLSVVVLAGNNLFVSTGGIIGNGIGYTDSTTSICSIDSADLGAFSEWSWSGWVKLHATAGIGNTTTLITLANFVYINNDGNDSLFLSTSSPGTDFPISPGEWHHIVVTSDGLNNSIYIDGSHKETIIESRPPEFCVLSLMLTAGWNETDYTYMDEMGQWSRILTLEEIAYLYNSGAGRTLYP